MIITDLIDNIFLLLHMNSVFIIAGEKKSGKTLFLKNLIPLLQLSGLSIGGFLALHNEKTDSYSIQNIQTTQEVLLMHRRFPPKPRPDHFQIMQKGINAGNDWIDGWLAKPPALITMDEIGYFELEGMVWSNLFTVLVNSSIHLIFTANINNLPAIIKKWNICPIKIFYPRDFQHIEDSARLILSTIGNIEK